MLHSYITIQLYLLILKIYGFSCFFFFVKSNCRGLKSLFWGLFALIHTVEISFRYVLLWVMYHMFRVGRFLSWHEKSMNGFVCWILISLICCIYKKIIIIINYLVMKKIKLYNNISILNIFRYNLFRMS